MTKSTIALSLLLATLSASGTAHARHSLRRAQDQQAQQSQAQQGVHAEGAGEHSAFNNADFDRFHDVLHPLQHDALPKNDFATIRREAKRLVAAGRPLTRGFVPAGVTDTAKFCEEQANFADALKRFDRDAKRKDDEAMKRSYIRVHDTFEEMAHLLPRR